MRYSPLLKVGLTCPLLSLALWLPACPKPSVKSQGDRVADERPTTKGQEVRSVKLPKSMVVGNNVALSGFYEDDAELAGPGESSKTTDERPARGGGAGAGVSQNLYRVVAPAVVIVRSQRGYGTGVIYDPAGWILTNHHVVAHAEMDGFRMKVSVGIGRLNKQGVMEQREETYDAYVHKKDPLRDLAVIKLIKPPRGLSAVRISDGDPVPGQAVTSIGHAGIGLLWAIKDGQISAIGKLSKHLAELQLYEAGKHHSGPSQISDQLKTRKLAELRKYLESKIPALVIQSTCDISQGDSGGPLVNSRAELVGLNAFVRSTMAARKESNFHIHVAEIRKFIKHVPKQAPQLLPDPWVEGGAVANMGDADLDGVVDTLALYQVVRYGFFQRKMPGAFFLDLDQDSFSGAVPEVRDVVQKKAFDAELIYLSHGNYLYAWYDTDGDRKPDVLLVADAAGKVVQQAYRIAADGELKEDRALVSGTLIRPALFTSPAMSQRLAAVAGDIFGNQLLPPGTITAGNRFPDPIKSAGHKGTLRDLSRDGKPDTVAAEGLFSSGFIFDVDQDSLGGFKEGDSLEQARSRGIDAEVSWIALKGGFWVYYDTDNNGAFDLLFHAHRYPMDVVNEAWRVAPDGTKTPDTSHLGQYLVQPELLGAQAATFRTMAGRVLPSRKVAGGGGLKVFPDPGAYYGFGYRLKEVKGLKDVALEVRLASCSGLLIDVDRDTARRAKKEKRSMEEMVRAGKFDAEFAQVQCGSDVWTMYDTRGKGYDVVLYSSKGASGKPEVSYTVHGDGVSPRSREVACGSMFIPGLFHTVAQQRTYHRIASELLRNVADLKCKP